MADNIIKKTYEFKVNVDDTGVGKKFDDILGKFGKVKDVIGDKVIIALDKNIEGYDIVQQQLEKLVEHINIGLSFDENARKVLEEQVKILTDARTALETGLKGHDYAVTQKELIAQLSELEKNYSKVAAAAEKLYGTDKAKKLNKGIVSEKDINLIKAAYIVIQQYTKEIEELYSSGKWKRDSDVFSQLAQKTNALNTALDFIEKKTEKIQKKTGDGSSQLPGFSEKTLIASRDRVDKIFEEVAEQAAELREDLRKEISGANEQIEKIGSIAKEPEKLREFTRTFSAFEQTIKNIADGKGAFNFWLEYREIIESVGKAANDALQEVKKLKAASEKWKFGATSGSMTGKEMFDQIAKAQKNQAKVEAELDAKSKKKTSNTLSDVEKIKQSYDSLIKSIKEVGKQLEVLITGEGVGKLEPLVTKISVAKDAKKSLVADGNKVIESASKDKGLKKLVTSVSIEQQKEVQKENSQKKLSLTFDENSINNLINDVKKAVYVVSRSKDVDPVTVNIKPKKEVLDTLPKDINSIINKYIKQSSLSPIKVNIKPDKAVLETLPKDVNNIINKYINTKALGPIKVAISPNKTSKASLIKDVNSVIKNYIKEPDIKPVTIKIKPDKAVLKTLPKDINSIINNYIKTDSLASVKIKIAADKSSTASLKKEINNIIGKEIKSSSLTPVKVKIKPDKSVLTSLPKDINTIITKYIKASSLKPVTVGITIDKTKSASGALIKEIQTLLKSIKTSAIAPVKVSIKPDKSVLTTLKKDVNNIVTNYIKSSSLEPIKVRIKPDKSVVSSLIKDVNKIITDYVKVDALQAIKVGIQPDKSVSANLKTTKEKLEKINKVLEQTGGQVKILTKHFNGLKIGLGLSINSGNKMLENMRDLLKAINKELLVLKISYGTTFKQVTYNTNTQQADTQKAGASSAQKQFDSLYKSVEKYVTGTKYAALATNQLEKDFIEGADAIKIARNAMWEFSEELRDLKNDGAPFTDDFVRYSKERFSRLQNDISSAVKSATPTKELTKDINKLNTEISKFKNSSMYVNALGQDLREEFASGASAIEEAALKLSKFFEFLEKNPIRSKKQLSIVKEEFEKLQNSLTAAYAGAVPGSINKGASPFTKFAPINDIEGAVNTVKSLSMAIDGMNGKIEVGVTRANGLTRITEKFKAQGGVIKKNVYEYDRLTGALYRVGDASKEVLTFSERVALAFRRQGAQLVAQIGTFISFYRVLQTLREGAIIVKEIDSAMTELRKVSEATELQLANFEKQAFNLGRQVGTTGKEIINSAAAWSRLGYSIEEAGELAKVASIYLNVGDSLEGIDVATDHLVSTLKAFSIEAEDSMKVIDAFNEVANTFATSAGDIGEGLKRSSAALSVAGNDLNQSIAMFTAAQEIVQNAESVGTALRTVSLRLRGKVLCPSIAKAIVRVTQINKKYAA